MTRLRVAVLVSGSGTNLGALLEAAQDPTWPVEIVVVGSDRPRCAGLARARAASVPTIALAGREQPDRATFDAAMLAALAPYRPAWIVLAGYMRILSPTFLDAYPGRIVNIHPSLLPAFPGLHAQRQAWEAGVRVAGCTVHLVDGGLDSGPILAQGAVDVDPNGSDEDLRRAILAVEHQIYRATLAQLATHDLVVDGARCRFLPRSPPHPADGAGPSPG